MSERNTILGTKVDRVFGILEISDACSSNGCELGAVAVLPIATASVTGAYWTCGEHARVLQERCAEVRGLSQTCIAGEAAPCGAAATHIAIIGTRGGSRTTQLEVVSVCEPHAEAFGPLPLNESTGRGRKLPLQA